MSADQQPALNTDRELWREREGDYYSNSIHITAGGGIGINVGGHVVVLPLELWFAAGKKELEKASKPAPSAGSVCPTCHRSEESYKFWSGVCPDPFHRHLTPESGKEGETNVEPITDTNSIHSTADISQAVTTPLTTAPAQGAEELAQRIYDRLFRIEIVATVASESPQAELATKILRHEMIAAIRCEIGDFVAHVTTHKEREIERLRQLATRLSNRLGHDRMGAAGGSCSKFCIACETDAALGKDVSDDQS